MSRSYDRACGLECDPAKATRNATKHGVSFDEASTVAGELGEVFHAASNCGRRLLGEFAVLGRPGRFYAGGSIRS